MFATDPPLMRAKKPSFQQRGHQVDARQQLGGRFLVVLLDDPIVNVAVLRQSQVTVQTIRSDRTARLHDITDEATQFVGRRDSGTRWANATAKDTRDKPPPRRTSC